MLLMISLMSKSRIAVTVTITTAISIIIFTRASRKITLTIIRVTL